MRGAHAAQNRTHVTCFPSEFVLITFFGAKVVYFWQKAKHVSHTHTRPGRVRRSGSEHLDLRPDRDSHSDPQHLLLHLLFALISVFCTKQLHPIVTTRISQSRFAGPIREVGASGNHRMSFSGWLLHAGAAGSGHLRTLAATRLCVAFAFDHFSMDDANSAEQRRTRAEQRKNRRLHFRTV